MHHLLVIVINVALSLFGVGFVIWGSYRILRRNPDPGQLLVKWAFTVLLVLFCFWLAIMLGPVGPFVIVVMAVILSIMWTPHIAETLLSPLTSLWDGGKEAPDKKPYYSIALARRKMGKPLEAVVVVREQLAKFPNDLEGVLLLAAIQAEDLADLPGATITLNKFCASPNVPSRQVESSLRQLADWHLKIGADVESARAALQQLVDRYPGSEISLRAEQRLAHLGETAKILMDQHDRQPIALPEGVQNIGLLDSTEFLRPKEIEPGKLAAAYLQQLAAHPHDAEVREKLASIYAKDFKRLDLATMELEQLIAEPRYKPKQVINWLNLLASWQIELGADVATVTATLGRIVDLYPDSAAAEVAQRRLEHVKGELARQKNTPNKKLGVYEQNIGLKKNRSLRDEL